MKCRIRHHIAVAGILLAFQLEKLKNLGGDHPASQRMMNACLLPGVLVNTSPII